MRNIKLLDKLLISFSGCEFLLEVGLKFIYPARYQQKNILEYLSIFELLKFFLRYLKFEKNNSRKIFISERTTFLDKSDISPRQLDFEELFNFEEHNENQEDELHMRNTRKLENILDSLKNCKFNQGYEELFPRTKKIVPQISAMPIPNEILHRNKNDESENLKIWLGEIIYMFRPLVYCFSLLFFRYSSYKPYIISLILDILRIILQRNINFYWKNERSEFIKRNYDLLFNYCFRNPIYSKILKNKFLNPILSLIFGNITILKKLFFWIIELRLALSFLM